jgi:hypothetical protein
MPSNDLILNVRQIGNYTAALGAGPADSLLMQRGGLGGPYVSIAPAALVGTALATGGDMAVGGKLTALSVAGGSAQFNNGAFGMLSAQKACVVEFAATWGMLGGVAIATVEDVAATVTSFNGRVAAVRLWIDDLIAAGGAPNHSPRLTGSPRAETPPPGSHSTRLATTLFVHRNAIEYINGLLKDHPFVFSFNGRTGDVVLTADDLVAAGAPYAPLDSPNFTGNPTAPTAPPGASTGQIATTAFVMAAIAASVAGVASFNTRTGHVVLTAADITGAGGAMSASPAFTGIPTAPTAPPGTSTTQLATTGFVMTAAGTGLAPINSPAFTGTPTAPTAAVGTNTGQLATTAYVLAQITAIDAGVLTFNGRSGIVSLLGNDISAAGGAVLASPAFTGTPTAPTAAPGTNTTQLATTGFVMAADGAYLPLTGGTLSGNITIATVSPQITLAGTNNSVLVLNAAVGAFHNQIWGMKANSARWLLNPGDTSAETGGNTGSAFSIHRYSDAGNYIDTPVTIARANGATTLIGNLTVNGVLIGSQSAAFSSGVVATNFNTQGASPTMYWQLPGGTPNAGLIFWDSLQGFGMESVYPQWTEAGFVMDGGGAFRGNFPGDAHKQISTTWVVTSDIRIKTDINDYRGGLSEVIKLRPVTYRVKGNDTPTANVQARGREQQGRLGAARVRSLSAPYPASPHYHAAREQKLCVGLVAEEVSDVFPDMVTEAAGFIDGQPVNDMKELQISELLYALINACKELAARVATLEAAT